MLLEELLDLFHQPAVELLRHDGEVQRGRRVLGEIEEPALDALEAVLQTEVEDLARVRGKVPEGFAPRHPETQPQRQPGLADLRRAGQQVQSLGAADPSQEGERLVGDGLQGVGINGVEFFRWHENLLMVFEIQRKKILRFGRLSVRLNTDGSCVFRNAACRQTVAAVWRFSFCCADDRLSPPCDLDAPHRRAPCSIGTLVRCRTASEVPAILPLEHVPSGGGDAVVKVQGVAYQINA